MTNKPIIGIMKFSLAVSCIAFLSTVGSASILYSNITAGFPLDSGGGETTSGTLFATTFTTVSGGALSTVELTMQSTGVTTPITIGLYTDLSDAPGTLLESWIAGISTGAAPPATILTSLLHPSLSAATQYWIVLAEASSQVGWFVNDTGIMGGLWSGESLSAMSPFPSDSLTPGLELTSVPEPASAMLLGLGFGGLFLAKRALFRGRA